MSALVQTQTRSITSPTKSSNAKEPVSLSDTGSFAVPLYELRVENETESMDQPVRTYLAMTAPEALRRGHPAPTAVTVVYTVNRKLLEQLYVPLSQTYCWPTYAEWKSGYDKPGRYFFLIRAGSRNIGLAKFVRHENGRYELMNFGLLPEFTGQGFGGEALASVVERGWELLLAGATEGELLLSTSTDDHPHALPNYLARGFRVVEPRD